MDLRERLDRALRTGRGLTEKLLEDVTTDERWLASVVDRGNHALWIVGHLAVADDAFVGLVDSARTDRREDYRRQFGKGSKPIANMGQYDSPETMLSYFRARREALMDALSTLPEADFDKPLPDKAPAIMFDVASVFHMAAWHESLHTGQLTTIRRSFGLDPVV